MRLAHTAQSLRPSTASPVPPPEAHLWSRVPTGTVPFAAGEVLPGLGAGHLRPPVLPALTVGPGCGSWPAACQAQVEAGHLAGQVLEAAGQRGQLRAGLGVAGRTSLCATCSESRTPLHTCPDPDLWLLLANTIALRRPCSCHRPAPSPRSTLSVQTGESLLSSPWGPALWGTARSCLGGRTLCPAAQQIHLWAEGQAGPGAKQAGRAASGAAHIHTTCRWGLAPPELRESEGSFPRESGGCPPGGW